MDWVDGYLRLCFGSKILHNDKAYGYKDIVKDLGLNGYTLTGSDFIRWLKKFKLEKTQLSFLN